MGAESMKFELEHFERKEGVRGGKLVVKGTRVALEDIVEMLKAGYSPKEVAEELRVPVEAVLEAAQHIKKPSRRSSSQQRP